MERHGGCCARPEWFTTAYFHLPQELGQEVTEAGLRLHHRFAVEGPAWMLSDIQQRLADRPRRERVLAAIRRVETEPTLGGQAPMSREGLWAPCGFRPVVFRPAADQGRLPPTRPRGRLWKESS
jgi:hypothetical protein